MRKLLLFVVLTALGSTTFAQMTAHEAAVSMGRGINLGNTLDATNGEGSWGTEAREYYFDMYAEAGFKTIRIPITWDLRVGQEAPYTIDADFLARVDTIVNWTLDRDMFAIINIHHDAWAKNRDTFDETKPRVYAIWEQLSEHYKDYPEHLVFEVINEPHHEVGDEDKSLTIPQLNELNKKVLEIIRVNNPTRITAYGGKQWSGSWDLFDAAIPDKNDKYLMGYYHSYDPYKFGLLGEGTWGSEGDMKEMEDQINNVKEWSEENNIPVLLGEYGATAENREDWNSQMRYYAHYAKSVALAGIPSCVWDDDGNFQILERVDTSWNDIKDIVIHSSDSSLINFETAIVDDTVISISWEDIATTKKKTTIERRTLTTDYSPIGIMGAASGTTYFDATAEVGTNYIYRLIEVFADAEIPAYPQSAMIMSTERSPYHGEAIAIPGTLEAEDYDIGGEGLTYHDTEAANQGGAYRLTEGVDIEALPDDAGFQVGYVATGEWIEYTVNVEVAGDYTITSHFASTQDNGQLSFEVDGKELVTIDAPNTGGWTTIEEVKNNITLEAGEQIIRLNILSETAFNMDKFVFTKGATSINDLSANSINIYPNPATDQVFVSLANDQTIKSIDILDINGRMIEQVIANTNAVQVNTSNLNQGVYFMNIHTESTSITKKFMIK